MARDLKLASGKQVREDIDDGELLLLNWQRTAGKQALGDYKDCLRSTMPPEIERRLCPEPAPNLTVFRYDLANPDDLVR